MPAAVTPITGVPPISGTGAYGAVPGTPDPTSTAAAAIAGNNQNLADLYQLAVGTSQASAAGENAQYVANLPGYTANRQAQSNNIAQELAGQVPQDVINLIAQQSEEIGAGAGMGPTSPLSNADYLRALGLTSLGMQQTGSTQLNSQIQTTPTGPAFNPSSMQVTPGQEQSAAEQASVMAAAPNPEQAAIANQQALLAAINAAKSGFNPNTGTSPGTGTTGKTTTTTGGTSSFPSVAPGTPIGGGLGGGTGGGLPGAAYKQFLQSLGIGSVPGTSATQSDANGNTWIDAGNGMLYNTNTGEYTMSGSSLFPAINDPLSGSGGLPVGADGLPDYSAIQPDPMGGLANAGAPYIDEWGQIVYPWEDNTSGGQQAAPTDPLYMDPGLFGATIGGGADMGGGYYGP